MHSRDLLYFIASIIGISSFFLTDILYLRSLYLLSSTLFVISGYIFDIKIIMIMNLFYMLVNMIQITRLIMERTTIILPDDLKPLYSQLFSSMLPKEFLNFIKSGKQKNAPNKKYLLYENDQEDYLRLLIKGKLLVMHGDLVVAELAPYSFIGEMRFITNEPISADIKTATDVSYIEWDFNKLYRIRKKNSQLYMKLVAILSNDVIKKIHKDSENPAAI